VYAWLVYLMFFFAYAAVAKSVQVWVLSLLAVAAFLPLYSEDSRKKDAGCSRSPGRSSSSGR
jgi:hypothetical protein